MDKDYVAKFYGKDAPVASEEPDLSLVVFANPTFRDNNLITEDYFARALVDLESSDTSTRRDARARLAQEFNRDPTLVNSQPIVNALEDTSYRKSVGIAAALTATTARVDLDPVTASSLEKAISRFDDDTLDGFGEALIERGSIEDR